MKSSHLRTLWIGSGASVIAAALVFAWASKPHGPFHRHTGQRLTPSKAHPVGDEMVRHAGHSGMEDGFRWDHLDAPVPRGEPVALNNERDPVSLNPAGDLTLNYKGYLIRFENERCLERFRDKPIKYLGQLSLEPLPDGRVVRVDDSAYQKAVTEYCPFMPESEVDPHGTVYLLHRGWKFYFCCWSGCGDQFMRDPAAWYDTYGLADEAGRLVRVREPEVAYVEGNPAGAPAMANGSSAAVSSPCLLMVSVPDMACQRCAAIIDGELGMRKGILGRQINVEAQIAVVQFDPAAITRQSILEVIEGAGYTARLLE